MLNAILVGKDYRVGRAYIAILLTRFLRRLGRTKKVTHQDDSFSLNGIALTPFMKLLCQRLFSQWILIKPNSGIFFDKGH